MRQFDVNNSFIVNIPCGSYRYLWRLHVLQITLTLTLDFPHPFIELHGCMIFHELTSDVGILMR